MQKRAVPHDSGENRSRENKNVIEVEGKVVEALPNAVFRVQLDLSADPPAERAGKAGRSQEVLAHIAGRLRVHHIRILPGDRVRVELTPYDLRRGRITRRL